MKIRNSVLCRQYIGIFTFWISVYWALPFFAEFDCFLQFILFHREWMVVSAGAHEIKEAKAVFILIFR